MSTYTHDQPAPLSARVTAILVITGVFAVLVGGAAFGIKALLDANDRRNAVASAERKAYVAEAHRSMDALAASADPSTKVIFESWNGQNTHNAKVPATAKVAFPGHLYRVCDFTDKYGMLCEAQPTPAPVLED